MERGGDLETLELEASFLKLGLGSFDGICCTRDHDLCWAVMVCHNHIKSPGLEVFAHNINLSHNCGHGAIKFACSSHEFAALTCDGKEAILIHDARGEHGGDLTKAVTTHAAWLDAKAVKQGQHSKASCTNCRLCPLCCGECVELFLFRLVTKWCGREHHVMKLDLGIKFHISGHVPDLTCLIKVNGELVAHVDVLASLAREEEGNLTCFLVKAIMNTIWCGVCTLGRFLEVVTDKLELLGQVSRIFCDDGKARGVLRIVALEAAVSEELEEVMLWMLGERIDGAEQLCTKLGGRCAGPCEELRRLNSEFFSFFTRTVILLKCDVEVCATEAKGADRCATRVVRGANPGARCSRNVEGAVFKVEHGVWIVDLDGGRNDLVVKRHGHLEQTSRTCACLGVTNLRLHRTKRTPLTVLAVVLIVEHDLQTAHFSSITCFCTCTVCFHKLHSLGTIACVLVSAPESFGLTA